MRLKNLYIDFFIMCQSQFDQLSDSIFFFQFALLSSVCWLHPQSVAKCLTTCFLIHIQEEREAFFSPELKNK